MRHDIRHATPLYLTAEIRRIEARYAQLPLMERAGHSAAQLARQTAGDGGKPVLIFAGPGNNGGDAFVVARHLKQSFYAVTVVFAGDVAKLPADAAEAYAKWLATGGVTVNAPPPRQDWGLVVDGLFGVGLTRDITGQFADWIACINRYPAPVLAIDIPSGLDADTGAIHGCCVRATHTLTFIGAKPGLFTLDGPDQCGTVQVEDLDLPRDAGAGCLLADNATQGVLTPRRLNSHKGSHGSLGIVGGDSGMVGAALLAGRAALKLGAGRVYAGLLSPDAPRVDFEQPELMLRSVDEVLKLTHLTCLAIGPGLGPSPEATLYLRSALQSDLPLVLDADALNAVAATPALQAMLTQYAGPKVLTPHPAEAARLLACDTREVQADRIAAAQAIADRFQAHVVLKGAGSICSSPNAPWRINTSGNPGMASAGMGDVLTGIIAALLTQGASPQHALDAAVWLHGAAADACVADRIGPVGLAASDTIPPAQRLLNASIENG